MRAAPRIAQGAPSAARVAGSCTALREGLSEEQLGRLWEGQRFPADALRTRCGEVIQVVYPGRRGRGPGPDFRDAILAVADGRLLQGDVELHVRASDFRAHGHHMDPAYGGLVLHLVFWDDAGEVSPLPTGGRAMVAALAPWVWQRAADLAGWLSAPARWREPCRGAVARLGQEAVAAVLDRLGDRRFAQKAAAFAGRLASTDAEEVLYGALAEAMGYGGERTAFAALAAAAPWPWLRRALGESPPAERAETAEALLLGSLGLLTWSCGGSYARSLLVRWQRVTGGAPLWRCWRRQGGTRPANHPQRRLAGLARFLVPYSEGGLVAGLRQVVAEAAVGGPPLAAVLTVPAEGFWASHRDLSGRPLRRAQGGSGRRAPALIGPGRVLEVATNALLPFFAAWGQKHGDRRLEGTAEALYRRLPRPEAYGVVHFLEENLVEAGRIASARRQQALLYLLQNYCSRGGCGYCPLS